MKQFHPTLTIVPGRVVFNSATRADYAAIARHHYRAKPPATFCQIRGAWHCDGSNAERRLIAVAVLSWPVPMLGPRLRHFAVPPTYRAALSFANANVRTISRVVVHPQFRSIGLAAHLVQQLIDGATTRYVETSAAMGDFVGCFTAAGMQRLPTLSHEPAYFLIDRSRAPTKSSLAAFASHSPLPPPEICHES